ncbi:D-alanine--D-alanine ligase [Flavobacterium sp.]|uniref:D-alanine--D-alanine ligase n=1 Tax=Flavobacterium sp. TaxID=239 RepID=UPI0034580AEA
MKTRIFLHKLANWEYWPQQIVYIPVYLQWIWYSLRARSVFFFNASNPSIKNGGFFMESKKEIYDMLPIGTYPKTSFVAMEMSAEEAIDSFQISKIDFPVIAKPNMGQRGTAVKKLHSLDEISAYAKRATFDFLIQECIPFENEIGIFYVRYPHEQLGKITGIVAKEFLSVTGDGVSTIEKLLQKDFRHAMQASAIAKEIGAGMHEILPMGKKRKLVPFGNHIRGSKFTDASHLITPKLVEAINAICLEIPDFYFGRLDVMFENWRDLENGKKYAIIEINGASSEPTHIYDPKHSIFFGWKELTRHLRYMFEIASINKRKGVSYLSRKDGIREYREYVAHNKKFVDF